MVVGQMPTRADITILHPHIRIILRKRDLHHRILHKDRGMGLAVDMHDLALIVHKVLQTHRRGNHLSRGAEVIELTTSQRQDGHRELTELRIVDRRLSAKATAELGIEVVFLKASRARQASITR